MNNKWIYALFGVLLLGGLAFAIEEAAVGTEVERGRWSNTAGSAVTEGGNVSGVNVTAGVLTEKWASFYGDVVGSIVLADVAGTNVYNWSWAATDGGEVCLVQDQTFDWTTVEATTGGEVDTAFGFTAADTDSATSTTTSACTVSLVEGSATSVGPTLLSGYQTCWVANAQTTPTTNDLAFCTDINATGVNYNSEAADYEVMVPTPETDGASATYYFFVELN